MHRFARKIVAATLSSLAIAAGAASAAPAGAGSDQAFDHWLGGMAARDSGSAWLDGYLAELNQQIAEHDGTAAYGAAGPNGPLEGFSGYVAGFLPTDSGSARFNDYVDALNQRIRSGQTD